MLWLFNVFVFSLPFSRCKTYAVFRDILKLLVHRLNVKEKEKEHSWIVRMLNVTEFSLEEKLEIVELLIEAGADVNKRTKGRPSKKGVTPLEYAAGKQLLPLFDLLRKHGAYECKEFDGEPIIVHLALKKRKKRMIEELVSSGVACVTCEDLYCALGKKCKAVNVGFLFGLLSENERNTFKLDNFIEASGKSYTEMLEVLSNAGFKPSPSNGWFLFSASSFVILLHSS